MDEVEVARQTEQLTSETAAFFRVFSAADQGPPGFAGGFCGCGDFFQSINAFGVQHLSGNAEGTGEIAGADKERESTPSVSAMAWAHSTASGVSIWMVSQRSRLAFWICSS